MATHSRIAIKTANGIDSIFCYYNGYPAKVGKLLLENYNTIEKVQKLIDLGNLSNLDISYDQCVFYGRDKAIHSNSIEKFLIDADECWAEWVYLFDNKWLVSPIEIRGHADFRELTQEMTSTKEALHFFTPADNPARIPMSNIP